MWFWATFGLKFGLLAKSYVGYTSPEPPKRLGVKFPECMFFFLFSRTPVVPVHRPVDLSGEGWVLEVPELMSDMCNTWRRPLGPASKAIFGTQC